MSHSYLIRLAVLASLAASSALMTGCVNRKGACLDTCEPKESQIEACAKAASREVCEKSMKDPKKIADCKAQCEKMF